MSVDVQRICSCFYDLAQVTLAQQYQQNFRHHLCKNGHSASFIGAKPHTFAVVSSDAMYPNINPCLIQAV